MKATLNSLCICVCLIAASNCFGQGFLKASNGKIVNGSNQEVLLRGIGLGNWMLQEPYMLGLTDVAGTQHEIKSKIAAVTGEANTTAFYNAWLANNVRKPDVDSLKAWGFNSIRLPLHYNLFTLPSEQEPIAGQDTWLTKGFELTDSLLSWCKANQIYLILDLHAAPGGQGKDAAISDYDNTKSSLWQSTANQQKTVNLWKKLAERYANEEWIGGYDLLNETNWGFQNPSDNGCLESGNAPLRQLYISITSAIRQVDNNHLLFIEGNCYANNHSGLFPLWDNNVAISFHKYWNNNNTGDIQGYLNYRTQYNVPLWMGEGGENSNVWDRSAIALLETNGIGWSWWPLKKLGFSCPLEVKTNPGFQDIINYWKGNGVQPSATTAYNSLMQLTENVKLENCFYHKDFTDGMFRQVNSTAAIPFKSHFVTDTIYASDYDLGRNKSAYYDVDTADFHVSTGTYTPWNSGYNYRNDGVDIEMCYDGTTTNGYNVGWTQDGEWMQYTLQVQIPGVYDLQIRTAGNGGQVYFTANSAFITPFITLPSTGGYQTWQTTTISNVKLTAGTNVIKLYFETGGSNVNFFQFVLKTSLPVTLTDFTGKNVSETNVLNWATATEQNNSHFDVQHSTDGNSFNTIGSVKTKAVNGSSPAALTYTFTDVSPNAGSNFYRLQQVDKDGKIALSNVIKLDNTQGKKWSVVVMPNPVKDVANVLIYSSVNQQASLRLYSSEGRLVWSSHALLQGRSLKVQIPMQQLMPGIYRLVIDGKESKTTLNISRR